MKVIVNEEERKKVKEANFSVVDLIEGKIYEAEISKKMKWYRIIDETGETFLYPPCLFDIVD